MELYYKDLISKESSLEKLVDDLMLVVQGAEELAHAAGTQLGQDKEEVTSRLQQLKAGYRKMRQSATAGAEAADKFMRRYPYSTAGIAFAAGLIVSQLFRRRR